MNFQCDCLQKTNIRHSKFDTFKLVRCRGNFGIDHKKKMVLKFPNPARWTIETTSPDIILYCKVLIFAQRKTCCYINTYAVLCIPVFAYQFCKFPIFISFQGWWNREALKVSQSQNDFLVCSIFPKPTQKFLS